MKISIIVLTHALVIAITSARLLRKKHFPDDCGQSKSPLEACCDGDKYVLQTTDGRCVSKPAGYTLDYDKATDTYSYAADLEGDYVFPVTACSCDE